MNHLDDARRQIDDIDSHIVALFEKRMAVAAQVAVYKQQHNLPVRDAAREAQLIAARRTLLQNPELGGYCQELFECLLALSRSYQDDILQGGEHTT